MSTNGGGWVGGASFFVFAGCVSGFLAVALGAFGAHGLADKLSEKALSVYHTAAQYQMYHALALVGLGAWGGWAQQSVSAPGWCWILGTLVFAGSLYALALTDIKILGAITPIGGVLFLVGWILFAFKAWKA
jgi:uncharacterized membrane protein YgdD (TMEM256/DUF423 family)